MAWVQQTHTVLYRFRDNDGAESTCECHLPVGTSLDAALSFAAAMRPLITALCDAVMITYNVIARWIETNPSVPGVASVTSAGVFLFRTANLPRERYVLYLPAIRRNLVLTVGDFADVQINANNADVAAFISAITDGIDGVRIRAPWAFFADIAGGGGTWGGGGGGGQWGGGGGGGPWGGGGGGGSWDWDWLDDFYQGTSALVNEFIIAYRGRSSVRLSNRQI